MTPMFCSTIIPTVGRPTLSRAVHSVLSQDFEREDFEVIVVNDSGEPLPDEEWQKSTRVRLIHTNRRERSSARNAGAAIAGGRYLHFLDDDDWMLQGSFESLWELANTAQAVWLYGGYRLVDCSGNLIEECYPNESGNCLIRFIAHEWLPLQASLIEAKAFFAEGGFDPLLNSNEDIDFARRISLHGDIAGTSALVTSYRTGPEGSTTDYSYARLRETSLWSREKVLNRPAAFTRMRASATARTANRSYWHGRIVWTYLISVIWNMQHKKLFTAASRMVYGIASLVLAGRHSLTPGFWRGVTKPHIANGWLHSGE